MAKKCIDIQCPYLASDGTCLLKIEEKKCKCLANETINNEDKDEWMNEQYLRDYLGSGP